jgi:hypothetical protein
MKYVAAAAFAALIAGCSGVSTMPASTASLGSSAATAAGADAKTKCHVSKVMPVNVAGFITLPTCFGISGKMQFPKALSPGITITVTTSAKPFHVYYKYPQTAVILQWTFTSSSYSQGSVISFIYTHAGTSAPDVVNGPFKPGEKYHVVYEIPIPNDPHPKGGLTFGGYTVGHSVRGVPFPGTQVEEGVKNYEIFTSDTHA